MPQKAKYYDLRADFWKKHFANAQPLNEYLEHSDPVHASKWARMGESIRSLDDRQKARVGGHGRTLNVLVYSGVWCGDCVRQGPMIEAVASSSGAPTAVRFIDRDASPALQDELRVLGALRVPIVVFLSEDFHEVMRFGDRTLTAYRRKAERETGAACETGLLPPGPDALAAELSEWVDIFERVFLMLRLAPPLRARHND